MKMWHWKQIKGHNNSAPFIETKARFPLMFNRAGLTAMLGTAVSGRSIIVLRCHHPAWTGHSPRNTAQNVQNNGGVKPNTQRVGPWRRCGPSETNEVALKNEWKRLNYMCNSTSRCSTAKENASCSVPQEPNEAEKIRPVETFKIKCLPEHVRKNMTNQTTKLVSYWKWCIFNWYYFFISVCNLKAYRQKTSDIWILNYENRINIIYKCTVKCFLFHYCQYVFTIHSEIA